MLENFKDAGDSSTEHLLKSILDSAQYGIMTFKSLRNDQDEIIDFVCLFANDIALQIVQIPKAKIEGGRLLELMPGNKASGLFDQYVKVVESSHQLDLEQYYPGEDINKWFRITAVPLGDGFTVTFQDISDLKGAIVEIENREKKYQKLFEESMDAIFLINNGFEFIEVNTALLQLLGYPQTELSSRSMGDIFASEKEKKVFQTQLIQRGKIEELEAQLLDRQSRKKYCLINCVTLPDEEKKEPVYLGVIRDITRRKQADRELILAEKLSMTGKIARTIAHEVRNPLTNLILALQQLQDEVPSDIEDAEMYFEIIQRNADRIGKLISDLLNSSKPKALKLVPQDLNTLVKEALALVRDRLKLKNMQVQENFTPQLPPLYLDEDQFKVALLNLLVNAIEAMEAEEGKLRLHTFQEESQVILHIEDNGKGIPKEYQEKLFEAFFTAKQDGSGLGLTTVQNIIQSHKGQIEVESEEGQGSTFIIKLPIPV